jgi:LmbE family N-acetylglucosaminyl deacetylase
MNSLPGSQPSGSLLDQLRRGKVIVVTAHPDDETIGAGILLRQTRNPVLIHVTDGAPRDMRDALAAGFSSRSDYAAARRQEVSQALSVAGVTPTETIQLQCVDQEASFKLVEITCALVDHFRRLRPDFVVTHPYEGGHPDHDAVAFGVHAACALLRENEQPAPLIVEMTSYHSSFGEMAVARFLAAHGTPPEALHLNNEERELKQRMFRCFVTQQRVLSSFPIEEELFRLAPHYSFTDVPHPGRLFYEQFEWGMTGSRWRKLATTALEQLGLAEDPVDVVICAK